ncbi:MAG: hypothetical protein RR942_18065, partial [Romboutsia sp.]
DINIISKSDIINSKEEFLNRNEIKSNENIKQSYTEMDYTLEYEEKSTGIDEVNITEKLMEIKQLFDLNVIDEDEFKLLKYKLISNI